MPATKSAVLSTHRHRFYFSLAAPSEVPCDNAPCVDGCDTLQLVQVVGGMAEIDGNQNISKPVQSDFD